MIVSKKTNETEGRACGMCTAALPGFNGLYGYTQIVGKNMLGHLRIHADLPDLIFVIFGDRIDFIRDRPGRSVSAGKINCLKQSFLENVKTRCCKGCCKEPRVLEHRLSSRENRYRLKIQTYVYILRAYHRL